MAYLNLKNLTKKFGSATAVEEFNLAIEKGEFVSFLGPSGCGKTTTLRMVAGFELPSAGTVTLDGEDITHLPASRRNVGMVFQSYALFPNMTVAQNIGFGLKVRNAPAEEIQSRVTEMLELMQLAAYGDRYPYQLSGGQQQRIALSRALAFRPRVLLLDEPLSALDAKIRVELRLEIRRIQQQLGITTIYVTHDQEEALSLSDRVVVMSQGHIEQVGPPAQIYNYPQSEFVAAFVGQLNLLDVTAVDAAAGDFTLAGQPVRVSRAPTSAANTLPRLAVRPEAVQMGHVAGHNNLTGRVDHLMFLGAVVRMRIDLAGQLLSIDMFNEHGLTFPREGDNVGIHFPVEACWVM